MAENQILAIREWGERVTRKEFIPGENPVICLEMYHPEKHRHTWMLIPVQAEEVEIDG